MSEAVFLGACPVIKPEGIYLNGHRVIRFGMSGVGVGDVGDLLAYRQEWEPFIEAHLNLWRDLDTWLESNPAVQKCPTGEFTDAQIKTLDPTAYAFCASVQRARFRTSATNPDGILTQWNAWKDKSSAEIVAGAPAMLQFHQDVVMRVGGAYAQDLIAIHKAWGLPLQLPDVPSFSTQQEIRARIEGAYITTKGVIQLIGYSASDLLGEARDLADATAKGLTDAAKAIPKTVHWAAIAATVAAVVVGGVLIVYYVPRQTRPQLPQGGT